MKPSRYYAYNPESFTFEKLGGHPGPYVLAVAAFALGILMACMAVFFIDYFIDSPRELVLKAEIAALQGQLARSEFQIRESSEKLDQIAQSDQELYGLLLQADDLPEDVRQVGVGGSDVYEEFDRYSAATADLLRSSSEQLDQLERRIALQQERFSELISLAQNRSEVFDQLPAVMPANGKVASHFGMRMHPILKSVRHHGGIDIPLPIGSPVFATGDGIVKSVKRARSGYGLSVVIAHPKSGYKTLYAHLSEFAPHIRRGRRVERGEIIGRSGMTGLTAGPHLHYEVQDRNDRQLDPLRFIAPSLTPQQYQAMLESGDTVSLD